MHDPITPPTAPAPRAISNVPSVAEFLAKLTPDGVTEGWIRAAVVDALSEASGTSYELADPDDEWSGITVWATMSELVVERLTGDSGTSVPWQSMLGHELEFRLRTFRTEGGPPKTEIVGLDPGWIRREVASIRRHELRRLSLAARLDCQRWVAMPDPIKHIEVVFCPDNLPLGDLEPAMLVLRDTGTDWRPTPMELRGPVGVANLTAHLEAIKAGESFAPDLLMVLAARGSNDLFRILESPHVAGLVSGLEPLVVVGASRGRHGSLLHEVSFASAESPGDAIELLTDLVRTAAAAETVARRIRSHRAK